MTTENLLKRIKQLETRNAELHNELVQASLDMACWRKAAKGLWQLLDDISTFSNTCKDDLEAFGKVALNVSRCRLLWANSNNGRTLELAGRFKKTKKRMPSRRSRV